MSLKLALGIGFIWGFLVVGLGYLASRRRSHPLYFWLSFLVGEAVRWSLTVFLLQNLGKPIYVVGYHVEYDLFGLYLAMVLVALVGLVGAVLRWLQKSAFPGLYYLLLSIAGILALGYSWLNYL